MFLASTTQSNLNTDGSGITSSDVKEDHETFLLEGLMLESYNKKKKKRKKNSLKPKDIRTLRFIAWHSHLWYLNDVCGYFATGWRFLRGRNLRNDRSKGDSSPL